MIDKEECFSGGKAILLEEWGEGKKKQQRLGIRFGELVMDWFFFRDHREQKTKERTSPRRPKMTKVTGGGGPWKCYLLLCSNPGGLCWKKEETRGGGTLEGGGTSIRVSRLFTCCLSDQSSLLWRGGRSGGDYSRLFRKVLKKRRGE